MDKNNRPIEDIFDECCEKMLGGMSLEDVIRQYPNHAKELKELLSVAKMMNDTPPVEVSEHKVMSCLIKVGEEIQRQKENTFSARLSRLFFFPSVFWARGFAVVLAIFFISWGTINVSASSVPGDPLYLVKLLTEKVKYFMTVNPEGQMELKIVFSERRSKELVDQFNKDGHIDIQTLKAMLNEAGASLDAIAKLPVSEQKIYLTKLEFLNAYQKNVLQDLRAKVPESQKSKLDEAICTCNERDQQLHKAHSVCNMGCPCMLPKSLPFK
ncbi:MAG: hypothetical protein HQL14_06485 [Candidatus Omnitrophica bacterium]|nr:hypothetical protein [Candidatus Omnitrophota bacterium]